MLHYYFFGEKNYHYFDKCKWFNDNNNIDYYLNINKLIKIQKWLVH